MKRLLLRTLAVVLVASLPAQVIAQVDIEAILADPTRPQEDRDRDEGRQPARVLDFFDIGPGDHVADLFAGGGYWTRILVPLVGADGKAYAGNNPFYTEFYREPFEALLAEDSFANVVRVDGRADALPLPADGSLDAVLIVLAYHDLWLTDEDRGAMNRAIFAALKPGGVLGIIDHNAAPGAGASAVESLHRVEKQVVIDEVRAAGFGLVDEAGFLRNPEDGHTAGVFDPAIQGKTDRFVLRFEKPRPLFASEEPLELTLTAPMRTLVNKRADYPEVGGVLSVAGPDGAPIQLDVEVRTRGKSRLSICSFPPLYIDFKRSQVANTVFAGQNQLKLATRCKESEAYDQWLTLEYLVYGVYAQVSDVAYRVRPVRVRYVNTERDNEVEEAPAFFIEQSDELAARVGMVAIEVPTVEVADIDPVRLAVHSLFEYFIGNTDYAVTRPNQNDTECCHNNAPLVPIGGGPTVVVPFDFDQSGFVNTSYALPNEQLGIRTVRDRLYRGFCTSNEYLDMAIAKFKDARPAIEALLASARLDDRARNSVLEYVAKFYETVNDPKLLERDIIGECRSGGG